MRLGANEFERVLIVAWNGLSPAGSVDALAAGACAVFRMRAAVTRGRRE